MKIWEKLRRNKAEYKKLAPVYSSTSNDFEQDVLMQLSACQPPNNVVKVTGQQSRSASNSEVIILTLNSGQDIILKIFTTTNRFLLYESRVYEYISTNLPRYLFNLSRYITRSENCSFANLQEIIGGVNPENEIKLLTNVIYILCSLRDRPSFNDNTLDTALSLINQNRYCKNRYVDYLINMPYNEENWNKIRLYVYERVRFAFIASHRMKGKPLSLHVQDTVDHLHSYMFQILYTVYGLNMYGNHNDLHLGNIILDEWSVDETNRSYILDVQEYKIKTPLVPRIFDWDMAYFPDLGPNSRLELTVFESFGTNTYVSKYRDMFKFLCDLSQTTVKSKRDPYNLFAKYIKIVAFKPQYLDPIEYVFEQERVRGEHQQLPCFFFEEKLHVNDQFLSEIMYDPETIVRRAGEYLLGNKTYWNQALKMRFFQRQTKKWPFPQINSKI